jgi:acetolactate synthase-1/2/3 large subunit
MNIQELQYISVYKLPITIFVLNNSALGMIRHFQEMYFESNYFYSVSNKGYSVPDFCKVGKAYGIETKKIYSLEEVQKVVFDLNKPFIYEIVLEQNTIISPKLEYGKPNQDQEPLLERTLYEYLMNL